jgi:hypothetical protein
MDNLACPAELLKLLSLDPVETVREVAAQRIRWLAR